MENKYQGTSCPSCEAVFQTGDDIVVCPECGTPYHRGCIQRAEDCVNRDKHGSDFQWELPVAERSETEKNVDGLADKKCPRCGTMSAKDHLFCQVCGTPILSGNPVETENPVNLGNQPHMMNLNPFMNPYGGLDPQEQVNGITAKDLAIYVGQNTHYFLPKFKQNRDKKATSWNWAAFFLDFFYYLYRKMYGVAFVVLFVTTLVSLPGLVLNYTKFGSSLAPEVFALVSSISMIVSFGVKCGIGFYTNKIYQAHVYKNIQKIKTKNLPVEQYLEELTKKGSVSQKALLVAMFATMALSMIAGFAIIAILA